MRLMRHCLVAVALLSACAAKLPAQTVQGPITITPAPGALDTRLTVQGPEAFVMLDATDPDPAKEAPFVAFKVDLAGNRRKIGVLAFQFSGDPQAGFGMWNFHSTKVVDGTSTDTFQMLGCGGRRLSIFPYQIGPTFCAPEGWFWVNGNQRVTESLQVDGDLSGKTIAALEARIAALEARLAGTVPQTQPGPVQTTTIACPGQHAACKVLPAGTYQRAWADGLGIR
jgi:hypothetical protein